MLARGFALVRDEAGGALRRAAEVHEGQALRIESPTGNARRREPEQAVHETAWPSDGARANGPPYRNGEGQGSLF